MNRVIICDDQDVVCQGLRVILDSDPEIEVIGIAHDGAEAVDLVAQNPPDLVLMDLKMPVMNGIQATRLLRKKYPDVPVLVLTTYDADEWVFDAVRSGAAGYLLKDTPGEALIAAVKNTVAGKTYIDPVVAGKLLSHVANSPTSTDTSVVDALSIREKDVLRLLARGLSNADIAHQLHLSEGTVRNYVSAVFAKLDVADRTQAAVIALRYGLVDLSDI